MALLKQAVDVVLIGIELSGFEAFLQIVENQVRAAALDLLDGRDPLAFHQAAGVALDGLHPVDLTPIDKANRPSRAARTTRPADAVHVVFRVGRQVVIKYDVDFLDVQTACRDVGGDKDFHRAFAKAFQHALAHLLGDVAVQAIRRVAAIHEILGALVHRALRIAEYDTEARRIHVEDPGKHLDLRPLADFEIRLLDGGNGAGLLLDLDDFRAVAEFLD